MMTYPVYATWNGRYIGVDPSDPARFVYTDRASGGAWEELELTKHDDGRFDIRFVAADLTLAIEPSGHLTTRPKGTYGSYEQLYACNQPEGYSILYRHGVSVYLTLEARS